MPGCPFFDRSVARCLIFTSGPSTAGTCLLDARRWSRPIRGSTAPTTREKTATLTSTMPMRLRAGFETPMMMDDWRRPSLQICWPQLWNSRSMRVDCRRHPRRRARTAGVQQKDEVQRTSRPGHDATRLPQPKRPGGDRTDRPPRHGSQSAGLSALLRCVRIELRRQRLRYLRSEMPRLRRGPPRPRDLNVGSVPGPNSKLAPWMFQQQELWTPRSLPSAGTQAVRQPHGKVWSFGLARAASALPRPLRSERLKWLSGTASCGGTSSGYVPIRTYNARHKRRLRDLYLRRLEQEQDEAREVRREETASQNARLGRGTTWWQIEIGAAVALINARRCSWPSPP